MATSSEERMNPKCGYSMQASVVLQSSNFTLIWSTKLTFKLLGFSQWTSNEVKWSANVVKKKDVLAVSCGKEKNSHQENISNFFKKIWLGPFVRFDQDWFARFETFSRTKWGKPGITTQFMNCIGNEYRCRKENLHPIGCWLSILV